jgi:hypothetical protein
MYAPFSCAPLGLDLALLMPPHGLRRGLYSYAALRLDTWLCSCLRTAYAVGFILTPLCGWLPIDFLRMQPYGSSLLLSKYFALAVENTSLLLSKYFVLAIEILRSCYRNISLLMPKYFVPAIEILPD